MKISNYLLTIIMAGVLLVVVGCSKNQEVVPQPKVDKQQPTRSVSALQEEPRVESKSRAVRPLAKQIVSEKRVALVIGNAEYVSAGLLRNPVNDAQAVGNALQRLGFEVTTVTDANQKTMERSIRDFGKQLKQDKGVGLFYFAGHGMQFDGENYLLPTDIDPSTEEDVRYDAVPLGKLMAQLRAADNGMNVMVLDACRNNPFARSFRSSSRGLAQVTALTGSFISFATAPGSVASDGIPGENGLFTTKLLKHMNTPGLKLEDVFKQVRVDVQRESGNRQVPWDSSSVTGDFYFMPVVAAPSTPNTLDLGDLEELAAEEERKRREQHQIKARWANWQQQKQSDYEKVTAFEQRKISNDLKIDSWQLFLKSWSDDNPYSQQDGELRSMAESRVVHWQQLPQVMTLYISEEDWKIGFGTANKKWSASQQAENVSTYVGLVKGGNPSGYGVMTRANGRKYVGEWKDGFMNGQGTYTWSKGKWAGNKYVGEFKDGKYHGQGTYTWADGAKYVGEWKDEERNGQGTYTWPHGEVWSGPWKDGKFLGRK